MNFISRTLTKLQFFLVKLPILYALMLFGLMLEWIIELPFAILIALHGGLKRKYQ